MRRESECQQCICRKWTAKIANRHMYSSACETCYTAHHALCNPSVIVQHQVQSSVASDANYKVMYVGVEVFVAKCQYVSEFSLLTCRPSTQIDGLRTPPLRSCHFHPCGPFGGVAGWRRLRNVFRIPQLRSRKLESQLVIGCEMNLQCATHASRRCGYTCVSAASLGE
jgi:hypothetical protein